MLKARLRAAKREQRDRVILAWQIGAFVGMSKMTPLAKVLERLDPPEPEGLLPTAEIMRRMDLWRAAYARTQSL